MRYKNPKLVVGGIIKYKGKLLLIRRGINPGKGRWALPGGYVEYGEHPHKAVIRETKEECNVDAEIIDKRSFVYDVYVGPKRNPVHVVRLVFLLRIKSAKKMKPDNKEIMDIKLFTKKDYRKLTTDQIHFRHDAIIKDILKW